MNENLPVLLLRKLVLLPYQESRIELNLELSKKIMDIAEKFYNNKLLVIVPENALEENPTEEDLPRIGTLTKIKTKIMLPNGNYRVVLTGLNRVKVLNYRNLEMDKDILESTVKRIYIDTTEESEESSQTAILRALKEVVSRYMQINPSASNSVTNALENITDLDMLTDIITNYLPFDISKKICYMNEFDHIIRAKKLIKDINLELEVIHIESKIDDEIREYYEKEQKNVILKQKIIKLQEELGISAEKETEVSFYNDKIEKLEVGEKTRQKLKDEVRKYSYTNEANPDASVTRNYLDTVISLPWNHYTEDEYNLNRIEKSLNETHYGLKDVKTRILEYIAVKKNAKNVNAPILCLVGPPGVGKTTLASSVGKALKKEFYKISVAGLNDATELTGHKRTYLGSSPGKIIQGLKKCGAANPVILIDEVDKIVSDFKGDPSAVLLDILDSSGNQAFIDNYVEEPFDLSQVLFILTANEEKKIPSALKDRLEIIEISSYTEFEKVELAKKYIIPKLIRTYNMPKYRIQEDDLLYIITHYTKEAGVRELERILAKIFRSFLIDPQKSLTIKKTSIENILGPKKYDMKNKRNEYPGSVTTLGVSSYGGEIIRIEGILLDGNGTIKVNGNTTESLEESVDIAHMYCLSQTKHFKIDEKKWKNHDICLNALEYAIRKAGSSGGLAFAVSIISLLLNKVVDPYACFTGEITLHGEIAKVGGIKEKVIGAYNNGYKTVYLPLENQFDLLSVPEEIKTKMDIRLVSTFEEVFQALFLT